MSEVTPDLFGDDSGKGSGRPAFPLKVYAEKIWPGKDVKSSVRRLKRWQKKGRESGDPPPLDDLPALAAWYEKHHRLENAPPELRRFEETDVADPVEEIGEEEEELPAMKVDLEGDFTADEGLQQVRALGNALYQQMQHALETRQTKAYQALRREWQTLMNTRRQWEKDIQRIQEGKGEVLRTRVINSELVRIFTASGQSFFNGILKVLQDHAPHLAPEEQRRIALETRDGAFGHLRGSRFETAWTPGAN